MYQDRYYKNWGHTYYFGADGARYTDQFLTKNGKVYYFDKDGIMYQDRYYKNWGHTYYFGADGARYTDQFLTKNGKVYYFDKDGVMYQNQYYKNWGNTYYFGTNGARYTNQLLRLDGDNTAKIHYFDDQGRMMVNNWLNWEGSMIYFDKDGFPVDGMQKIDGQNFLFKHHALVPNGNHKITYNRYLSTLVGLYQNPNWFKENLGKNQMYYGRQDSGVNKGYDFITAKGDPTSWIYFKESKNGNIAIKYLDSSSETTVANMNFIEKIVTLSDLTAIYDNEKDSTMINDYAYKLNEY